VVLCITRGTRTPNPIAKQGKLLGHPSYLPAKIEPVAGAILLKFNCALAIIWGLL
jgi:hypothetical protein